MSNRAILLGAFFFAFVNALDFCQYTLKAMKTSISDLERNYAYTMDMSSPVIEKLLDGVYKITDEITVVMNKIRQLAGNVPFAMCVNSLECAKLFGNLDETAEYATLSASACSMIRLIPRFEHAVTNFHEISDHVSENLIRIRTEAQHCIDNVDGLESFAACTVCAKAVADKVNMVFTRVIPELNDKFTKLYDVLRILQPNLAYCNTTREITTFYNKSTTAIETIEKFIQQTSRKEIHV